uniref:TPR_REGION domain-containing protein n=1 Tax=Strongyloides venezuelensis TaxID=75913 RepID=A0A0K0FV70_STRVS
MTKKYERVSIRKNVTDSLSFFDGMIKHDEDLMKSNITLHFHDDEDEYKNLIFNDNGVDYDNILNQFLKKVLQYTKKKETSDIFFDITVRGAACLQDTLVDLVRINHLPDEMLKVFEKNFSSWLEPFSPNFCSLSIESSNYIKPILKLMLKGSHFIKSQLPQEIKNFPRVFIVDIIKLENKYPETSDAIRWTFVDIPCKNNAEIGNKLLKFLQKDYKQSEIILQIQKDPIISGIKDFLQRDTFSTVIFNTKNDKCFQNFIKIHDIISKWCICPQKLIKLDTEEYFKGVDSDVEYLKKIENEYQLVEVVPIEESIKLESDISTLKEINNLIITNIDGVKTKIEIIKKEILSNRKVIRKYNKSKELFKNNIEKLNIDYCNSVEKNCKLKSVLKNLMDKKDLITNDAEIQAKKCKELQATIDKLNYLNYNLEKELLEKEKVKEEILSEASKLHNVGISMYNEFNENLKKASEIYSALKIESEHNKQKLKEIFDFSEFEIMEQHLSNIVFDYLQVENKDRNELTKFCISIENELNLLKEHLTLEDENVFQMFNDFSILFDKTREKRIQS